MINFLRKNATYLFIISLIVVLVIRLGVIFHLYRIGFASLTADEFGRPLLAAQWALHPTFLYDGFWLPHFSYIYGIALRIVWNLVWVPRFLTISFGSATIVLLAYITIQLTRNVWYGLAVAVWLAANPLHIWFSAVALSDAPSWFFSFASISSYIAHIQHKKIGYLYLSSFFLFVANGLRFETWVISGLFVLALVVEGVSRIRRSELSDAYLSSLVSCGLIALIFPLFWMVASYIQTGDPLVTLQVVQSYKATWYGSTVDYMAYPRAFWNIDPLLAVLLPLVVIFGLLQLKKQPTIFFYTINAIILLGIFISFHRGRADPPISYQRYLAFYLFVLIPIMVYMIASIIRKITLLRHYTTFILVILILAYSVWHVSLASQFQNDPSVSGLRVGQYIKFLRKSDPYFAQKPVLLELHYWDNLAFHIGANDITQVYYDRTLSRSSPNADSIFLSDPQVLKSCIQQLNFSAIVVRSPELKTAVENELGLTPFTTINEYIIYKVPKDLSSLSHPGLSTCPLSPGTGY